MVVSFTGSTETGRKVMMAATMSNLKPVSLELGGKSPVLIFDDADVDKTVSRSSLVTVYNFQGEICVAFSRVYVQEGIYDEFEKKVVEKAKTWVVGDPFDPKIQQGSQTSKAQFEKILSYIELGKKEGATLLTGKKDLETREDMLISQDEIFGPVMTSRLLLPRRVSHMLRPPDAILLYLSETAFGNTVSLKDFIFDNSLITTFVER
ncbi:aldehyde dehydrogenase family 2 member C4-like [Arachis duranensis]|uniref:Aldehyde dehydrogenase family 2 member C4-like n=1 Tax=Arachis duranensis TaxID=130453 RepID=A0A9C6WDT4_ARADU|nr:aldehyde dehydrogenase family 2 member C4-like [Arachis duranensis]